MYIRMNIPFSPPDIGQDEINEVVDTLKSGWITTGKKTKLFENKLTEFCNTQKTVCLSSATAAMEMTLRVLGIGAGDEVITTAYTYTSTCSVICHVGAKPVLVDIQKNNLEMDYESLKNKINDKTKAIICVDVGGVLCNYEKINKIIQEKKSLFRPNNELQERIGRVILISDSAHGLGAMRNNKNSGEFSDFTCFSFHAVKNLTTAEGGAVTWKKNDKLDNEKIYKYFQILSLHGQTKDAFSKNKLGSWEYDILIPAYKCNMTDIMASIGLAQLKRYNKMLKRRYEIIEEYNKNLENFNVNILEHITNNSKSSGHLYIVKINNIEENERNEIIEEMTQRGIATNVHYKPLPLLTAYKKIGFNINEYPNSYNFYKGEITLPLYSRLTDNEIKYVINNFLEILRKHKK